MIFRLAYDELQSGAPEHADRDYLQMLKLATDVSEDRVTEAINEVVNRGTEGDRRINLRRSARR